MSISLSIKPIRRDQHLAKSAKSRLNCIFTRFLCEFVRLLTRETAVVCGANVKTINLCLSICTRHVSGASHFCSCKVVKISRVYGSQKNSERWFAMIQHHRRKKLKKKTFFHRFIYDNDVAQFRPQIWLLNYGHLVSCALEWVKNKKKFPTSRVADFALIFTCCLYSIEPNWISAPVEAMGITLWWVRSLCLLPLSVQINWFLMWLRDCEKWRKSFAHVHRWAKRRVH